MWFFIFLLLVQPVFAVEKVDNDTYSKTVQVDVEASKARISEIDNAINLYQRQIDERADEINKLETEKDVLETELIEAGDAGVEVGSIVVTP